MLVAFSGRITKRRSPPFDAGDVRTRPSVCCLNYVIVFKELLLFTHNTVYHVRTVYHDCTVYHDSTS